MAGIKNPREEIDLAEVHDCFSVTEMLIYEDFGFSKRGNAREDIENGFFELDGGLPVNTDGGLKCFGHPVGASGIRMTYEIYKQLQHKVDNPKRQVKDANRGLSHTFGGPPQISAVLILGNEKG
jgi:acetyl-CoA C-acetyltransferase